MEPSSAATAQTHPQPRTPAELWALLDSPDGQTLRARHVGEALLHLGLIDERQLREALQAQREERHRPEPQPGRPLPGRCLQ